MAISQVTYSNTFSHWLVTTNQLVTAVNTLSTGDFYKNLGTLYLNSPQTGLYVGNSAIFAGNVTISGPVGLSTTLDIRNPSYIYNTLNVSSSITGNSIRSNTILSSVNIYSSTVSVNTKLVVANSANLTGNVVITGNTKITGDSLLIGDTTLIGVTSLTGGAILDVWFPQPTLSSLSGQTIADLGGLENMDADRGVTRKIIEVEIDTQKEIGRAHV